MIVGPEGYFKIVVDQFDGQSIQAWHFEGPQGSVSGNLVGPISSGQNIDALINRINGTVNNILGARAVNLLDLLLE